MFRWPTGAGSLSAFSRTIISRKRCGQPGSKPDDPSLPWICWRSKAELEEGKSCHRRLWYRILDAAASTSGDHDSPTGDFGSSAGFLLDFLVRADYDPARVARLEWRLMPALHHRERSPATLHRLLAEDPDFFVEVVSLVYRAENEEPKEVTPAGRVALRLRPLGTHGMEYDPRATRPRRSRWPGPSPVA